MKGPHEPRVSATARPEPEKEITGGFTYQSSGVAVTESLGKRIARNLQLSDLSVKEIKIRSRSVSYRVTFRPNSTRTRLSFKPAGT